MYSEWHGMLVGPTFNGRGGSLLLQSGVDKLGQMRVLYLSNNKVRMVQQHGTS
jgi:hypothetical protein